MKIIAQRLTDRFLIVPNVECFFGQFQQEENPLEIVTSFTFKNVAEIYLARLGAMAFRFLDNGPLASIMRLRTSESGMVPDNVMRNHDEIIELQSRRLTFANFIAAALFGRLCAIKHSALSGAQYSGMDDIAGFDLIGTTISMENSRFADAVLSPKNRFAHENPEGVRIIAPEILAQGVEFISHVAEREQEFTYGNFQACMVMNYQAAILHNEQHSAASLALNFSVVEALVQEIFHVYGIVSGGARRIFARRQHSVPIMSNRKLSDWRLVQKLGALLDGGLMDRHLHQRLDAARILRNNLMHSAAAITVRQSGELQTAVRDLWSYFLDDPFELNAGWVMRI